MAREDVEVVRKTVDIGEQGWVGRVGLVCVELDDTTLSPTAYSPCHVALSRDSIPTRDSESPERGKGCLEVVDGLFHHGAVSGEL
jgi:hypothetical protein